MEIIKQGKPELQIKPSKPNTISCSECGCVFQYYYYDPHYATSIHKPDVLSLKDDDGNMFFAWKEWIVCPWCNAEIYGIFNFEEN